MLFDDRNSFPNAASQPAFVTCLLLVFLTVAVCRAADRQAPPEDDERQAAVAQLRRVFADRYDVSTSRPQKAQLARYLLQQSDRLQSAPHQLHAAIEEAVRLAVEAGDVKTAMDSVNQRATYFQIDNLRATGSVLAQLCGTVRDDQQRRELVTQLVENAERGLAARRIAGAQHLAALATEQARRSRDARLRAAAKTISEVIQKRQRDEAMLRQAKLTLASNSADPKANLIVGLHLCEYGNWTKGLQHLAHGSDASLRRAAHEDQSCGSDWTDQLARADRWRQLARNADRTYFRERSEYWYRRALPNADPLGRLKIEDQLASLTASTTPVSANATTSQTSLSNSRQPHRNLSQPRIAKKLSGHRDTIWQLAFHPDNGQLATASADKTVRLWQISDGTSRELKGHTDAVYSVDFSPTGQLASGSRDKTVRLWSVQEGAPETINIHESEVRAVAFSRDKRATVLASASADRTVRLIQLANKHVQVLTGHNNIVHSVCWLEDCLASGSLDKSVATWSPTKGRRTSPMPDVVHHISAAPDGRTIAAALNNQQLVVWDTTKNSTPTILSGHQGPVFGVAFSPDGAKIASASKDKTVRLWDATDGRLLATLAGHQDEVKTVAFSPDGRMLATAGKDKIVILWDIN